MRAKADQAVPRGTANSNGGLPVQLSVDDGTLQNQQTVSGTYPALTWQQLTINYTANSSGHVAIHLIVPYVSGNPSNLTAYFDDVRVFQGTQPSLTMNYAYDGFGNLVSKGATNGQYTTSMTVEGLTNRIVSAGGVSVGYTSNGSAQPTSGSPNNYTYDVLNRLTTTSQGGTKYASFAYMPGSNTRLLYSTTPGSAYLNFYGPTGQLLATYLIQPGSAPVEQVRYHYLDGKALDWTEDRVGSGANYLPYGDNAPPYGPSGTNPYATYLSDPASPGLYAKQRYYNLNWGRFLTVDPLGSSARNDNPQSWNRYSYSLGDPVNNSDPSGLDITCDAPPSSGEGVQSQNVCYGYSEGSVEDDHADPSVTVADTVTPVTTIYVPVADILAPDPGQGLGQYISFSLGGAIVGPQVSTASNNGPKPQQPQKPPCNPTTRVGGSIKALSGAGDAAVSFTLAGVHFGSAIFLVAAGCLDPTPFANLRPA